MLRVRHGNLASGIVAAGFWLGVTVGRFVLAFATAWCSLIERHAVAFCLVCCVALPLPFWLIGWRWVDEHDMASCLWLSDIHSPHMIPETSPLLYIRRMPPKSLTEDASTLVATFSKSLSSSLAACSIPSTSGNIIDHELHEQLVVWSYKPEEGDFSFRLGANARCTDEPCLH